MKSNEEQRKQLSTLMTNGYLERPVFAEAHNKLTMEYDHLVAKRDLLFRMDDAGYTMEQALKELVDFLFDIFHTVCVLFRIICCNGNKERFQDQIVSKYQLFIMVRKALFKSSSRIIFIEQDFESSK